MLKGLWADARLFSFFLFVAAQSFLVLRPEITQAAPFLLNYGSHMGSSVTFVDVTESNNEEGPLSQALFGPPIVSANSMDFNPIGFDATSANGIGAPDLTNGQLTFSIQAKPGNGIQNIRFSEIGDTVLAGAGTNATSTAVIMNGTINIHEVDGAGINVVSFPFAMAFTPSGGTYDLATEGMSATVWTGAALVNVQQELVNRSINFTLGATKVSVNLSNILTAMSETGTNSTISKKDAGLTVDVNVPEPASACAALVGLALAGLLGRGIRRRQR